MMHHKPRQYCWLSLIQYYGVGQVIKALVTPQTRPLVVKVYQLTKHLTHPMVERDIILDKLDDTWVKIHNLQSAK